MSLDWLSVIPRSDTQISMFIEITWSRNTRCLAPQKYVHPWPSLRYVLVLHTFRIILAWSCHGWLIYSMEPEYELIMNSKVVSGTPHDTALMTHAPLSSEHFSTLLPDDMWTRERWLVRVKPVVLPVSKTGREFKALRWRDYHERHCVVWSDLISVSLIHWHWTSHTWILLLQTDLKHKPSYNNLISYSV